MLSYIGSAWHVRNSVTRIATVYSWIINSIKRLHLLRINYTLRNLKQQQTSRMHQSQQVPRLEQVNINEVMEKIASKKDVYNFLTQECEAYLPKLDTVNIFFLKQITRGAKEVSTTLADLAVCEALCSEGVSGTLDRGPNY